MASDEEQGEDVKQEVKPETDHLNIKVRDTVREIARASDDARVGLNRTELESSYIFLNEIEK
jgi:hypothetical protein